MSKILKIDIINALKNNNIKFNYSDKKQQLLLLARKNKIKFGGEDKICLQKNKKNMEKIHYENQLNQDFTNIDKIDNIKYYINSILLHRNINIHVNKIELINQYIKIIILLNNEKEEIRKKINDHYTHYHRCITPRTSTTSNEILVDSWNLYNESCRLFILFYEENKNIYSYQKHIVDILTNLRDLKKYYDKQKVNIKFASMKFTQHYNKVNQVTLQTNYTEKLKMLFPNNLSNMLKRNSSSTRSSSRRTSSIRSSSKSSTKGRTNL